MWFLCIRVAFEFSSLVIKSPRYFSLSEFVMSSLFTSTGAHSDLSAFLPLWILAHLPRPRVNFFLSIKELMEALSAMVVGPHLLAKMISSTIWRGGTSTFPLNLDLGLCILLSQFYPLLWCTLTLPTRYPAWFYSMWYSLCVSTWCFYCNMRTIIFKEEQCQSIILYPGFPEIINTFM